MNNALSYLRSHITPQNRELLYGAALLGALATGVPAQESGNLDQAVTSVVLTGVALLLAMLNSSPRMAAVYAFLGAVGGVAQIVAVQQAGAAWAGYLGLGAVVLAKVIAALRAPSGQQTAQVVAGQVENVVASTITPQIEAVLRAYQNQPRSNVHVSNTEDTYTAAARAAKSRVDGGLHRAGL